MTSANLRLHEAQRGLNWPGLAPLTSIKCMQYGHWMATAHSPCVVVLTCCARTWLRKLAQLKKRRGGGSNQFAFGRDRNLLLAGQFVVEITVGVGSAGGGWRDFHAYSAIIVIAAKAATARTAATRRRTSSAIPVATIANSAAANRAF